MPANTVPTPNVTLRNSVIFISSSFFSLLRPEQANGSPTQVTSHEQRVTPHQLSEPGAGFSLHGLVDDVDGPLAAERTAHFTRCSGLQADHGGLAVPGHVRIDDDVFPPAQRMGVGKGLGIGGV